MEDTSFQSNKQANVIALIEVHWLLHESHPFISRNTLS